MWLTLAANHGAGHALNALEPVLEQMSVEEKQEAQARLGGFLNKRIADPARV